jgi:hypothetical protein
MAGLLLCCSGWERGELMGSTHAGQCPHCGGNLYLEPDLVGPQADLVCLQCMRRYPQRRRPAPPGAASSDPSGSGPLAPGGA